MPYDASVIRDGQKSYALLRDEQRLRFAHEVLGRVRRKDGTIHSSDLRHAGFTDLLGEFWLCFGWRERRRLARAGDSAFDAVFLDVVLDGAGYTATRVQKGVLRVEIAALRQGFEKLKAADDLRAGLRKWRLEEVHKHRSTLTKQRQCW
jgi:hypothetical protein